MSKILAKKISNLSMFCSGISSHIEKDKGKENAGFRFEVEHFMCPRHFSGHNVCNVLSICFTFQLGIKMPLRKITPSNRCSEAVALAQCTLESAKEMEKL